MSTIDPKQFIAAVRKRVEDNPDKIYEIPEVWSDSQGEAVEGQACVYVETDVETLVKSPSCLIGCALADIGVPLDLLEAHNESGIYTVNERIGLGLPYEVANWAAAAQGNQDNGIPWSRALMFADERESLPAEYKEVA